MIIVKEGDNPDDVIKSLMEIKPVEPGRVGCRGTCKVCGLIGPRCDLVRHIDANHISGAKYNCEYCNEAFKGKKILQVHMRNCTAKVIKLDFNEIKEQISIAELDLQIKSMIGTTETELLCTVCGITKPTLVGIKYHVESRHIKLKHTFVICETEVSTRKALRNHIDKRHK